ncbi:protein kinase [Achlya hypogyna]|uniref:Protein kinase n=1 Tax=Achlya hypogyna TaxID=1202772 RepID=A0A1V9Z242_ACHHY|nr:protein kinase [Achlya hypogyna]
MEAYEVLQPLAEAIYGRILLCRHIESQALFAVKQVNMAHATAHTTVTGGHVVDENVMTELAVNLELSAAGGHPHICPLEAHFYFDDGRQLALVFPYCPHKELLASLSSARRFPEHVALRYLGEIAGAVAFLHGQSIAHRDISLENILLTAADTTQLCDFGLATPTTTPSTAPVGKLLYMAPEVLHAKSYSPMRADMWALGVALFTMLVGRYPFKVAAPSDGFFATYQRSGLSGLLQAHGAAKLSPATLTLLTNLLEVAPHRRWTAAQLGSNIAAAPSPMMRDLLRHRPIVASPEARPVTAPSLHMSIRSPQVHVPTAAPTERKKSLSSLLKQHWRRWRPWRRHHAPTSAA